MKMTQDQRGTDRAKRMTELEDLVPNTLRCVEVLQRHAPTLMYATQWQNDCLPYRGGFVAGVLIRIAEGENVCPDQLWSVYKADFLLPE